MRERIGVWSRRYFGYAVFMENGVMHTEFEWRESESHLSFKKKFGKRFFNDESFWVGISYDVFETFLLSCDGMSEAQIIERAKAWLKKREERREAERKKTEPWRSLSEGLREVVIGVDKSVDVFNTGFNVRVICNSAATVEERKKSVRVSQSEFLRYVMFEVAKNRNAMSKLGDIRFYRPVEIVYLSSPQIEVKFEVKEVA